MEIEILVPAPGDLFTSAELLAMFLERCSDDYGIKTADIMARTLLRQGFKYFNGGKPLRTARGVHRYFVIRNEEKWLGATPAAAAKHINATQELGMGRGLARAFFNAVHGG